MDTEAFKTPNIPDWIREIKHPKYKNIFSYGLSNQHLWGTETFLGDWDGEYLLIAKDFYPTLYIEDGLNKRISNPYRHAPDIPTNRNLLKTLRNFDRLDFGTLNTESNFLYISACFLLRDDGMVRGKLPDQSVALTLSAPVVRFTIENMPNLRHVIAMGGDAATALKIGGIETVIRSKKLRLSNVKHPAYAMSDIVRFSEWESVFV